MNIYKYIILTMLWALSLSCSGPFDMKLDDEPIIYLESYPGSDEMIEFSILPAYSKSNSAILPEFNPQIRFMVNGEEIPVVLNKNFCVSEEYDSESYLADYKPVPGDKMTIEVSSEGFKSIYAETSIPQPFPDRKIDYREIQIGDDKYKVLYVTLKDDEDTDIAYGLSLCTEHYHKRDYYNDPELSIDTTYLSWSRGYQLRNEYDFVSSSMEGMNISFKKWNKDQQYTYRYKQLAGWDDDTFNGNEKTLSMALFDELYGGLYESPLYDENQETIGFWQESSRRKLILYTFSEEFFKYQVAQELGSENAGFFAGLAPSNFCYTNVVNGYGAFAGVCYEETDWITPEFIEKNR